jgi:DNA polymerase alpha-associated DNA helicase A
MKYFTCVFCFCTTDNIAERLLDLKLPITRLGHPARVLDSLSSSTLEYQLNTSDESEIIRDLKKEINQNLAKLSAQGKERVRGKARGLVYKDVQELRKDYRQRERGHTRNIIKSARIVCATAHGYFNILFISPLSMSIFYISLDS